MEDSSRVADSVILFYQTCMETEKERERERRIEGERRGIRFPAV